MMYFPKSQIQINLYTNGDQLSLVSDNSVYKGYYFKTSTGKYYTEKQPSKKGNHELKMINKNLSFTTNPRTLDDLNELEENNPTLIDISSGAYSSNPKELFTQKLLDLQLYSKKPTPRQLPQYSPTHPTEQDYQNGFFTRYFCKKNNELKYIEINKNMFSMLDNKTPNSAWDLYTPVSLNWLITGGNISTINSNNVIIASQKSNFPGFSQYFKNYSQYFKDLDSINQPKPNFQSNKNMNEGKSYRGGGNGSY